MGADGSFTCSCEGTNIRGDGVDCEWWAPVVMAALLADTLDTLEVSFDVPTNMAAMQQGLQRECSHLFQTDTLTLLLGGASDASGSFCLCNIHSPSHWLPQRSSLASQLELSCSHDMLGLLQCGWQ